MNVGWKFVAVLALLFSLTALVLEIMQIQRGQSAAAVRDEIGRQMEARDQALVDALAPRMNAIRANHDLPSASFQSLEEFMTEVLRLLESDVPARPSSNS